MNPQDLLDSRKTALSRIIRDAVEESPPTSVGFAVCVLAESQESSVIAGSRIAQLDGGKIEYGGYPDLALWGFRFWRQDSPNARDMESFKAGLARLHSRGETGVDTFAGDDVALLGVAIGLWRLLKLGDQEARAHIDWLIPLIDKTPRIISWSFRMRALAGDLLDSRGRLRVSPNLNGTDETALEVVLRDVWQEVFINSTTLDLQTQSALLNRLLSDYQPHQGDLERAVVWLKALDILVDYASRALFPSISDTIYILENVQHALKRWKWEDKAQRKSTMPARWLIDDEYDVQSLLWAILYPIYGSELVDETYLANWGFVQPRADLGILKIKLIIEVKFARSPNDFAEFEEQVSGDLGLYFKDPGQFDRMVVFVYDDCDTAHPEKYDSLRNALKKRERIEDVVFVRRPGMLPDRNQRHS